MYLRRVGMSCARLRCNIEMTATRVSTITSRVLFADDSDEDVVQATHLLKKVGMDVYTHGWCENELSEAIADFRAALKTYLCWASVCSMRSTSRSARARLTFLSFVDAGAPRKRRPRQPGLCDRRQGSCRVPPRFRRPGAELNQRCELLITRCHARLTQLMESDADGPLRHPHLYGQPTWRARPRRSETETRS